MKRFLSISFLIVFLAGQINLTWADHYCMNFKVQSSILIGHGDLDCGMGEMESCEEQDNDFTFPKFKAPQCCSNDYFSSDSDDHFFKSEITEKKQIAVYLTSVDASIFSPDGSLVVDNFVAKSPPLVHPEKQVWNQSFLI